MPPLETHAGLANTGGQVRAPPTTLEAVLQTPRTRAASACLALRASSTPVSPVC